MFARPPVRDLLCLASTEEEEGRPAVLLRGGRGEKSEEGM